MHISDLFAQHAATFSFEFFPPKTDKGWDALFGHIKELESLKPGFVSVTYGAGGTTREQTHNLVMRIKNETALMPIPHLPCVCHSEDAIKSILERYAEGGVKNILALGGDPPRDAEDYVAPSDGFEHADELVRFIRSRWSFCVGAACFPEVHPAAASAEEDLRHLLEKVRSGTDFLITQLFFDNQDYFDFVARARAIGIEVPIVAGIMPIVSAANIRRMSALCGARIPNELESELSRVAESDEATLELGMRWATMQCRELLDAGAPGIHFYTLNRSPATRHIFHELFGG